MKEIILQWTNNYHDDLETLKLFNVKHLNFWTRVVYMRLATAHWRQWNLMQLMKN